MGVKIQASLKGIGDAKGESMLGIDSKFAPIVAFCSVRHRKDSDVGLTRERFDDFPKKYSLYASWAIWDPTDPADTKIISNNLQCLKTSVIMVGLSPAGPLYTCWSNFQTF